MSQYKFIQYEQIYIEPAKLFFFSHFSAPSKVDTNESL